MKFYFQNTSFFCCRISLLLKKMENPTIDQLETKLFNAIDNGNLQEVDALIQKGVNLDSKNGNGNMPLHLAVTCGKETILEVLLENGAKIEETDSSEMTPLQIAVLRQKLLAAKVLLKFGADVEVKKRFGFSPLHIAISEGNISLAKLLIEFRADVNSPSQTGMLLPLSKAICRKDLAMLELLLQNGARPNIVNRHGPAIHLTIERKERKTFEMLLKYGALLEIKNGFGMTPLEVDLDATDQKLEFVKTISYLKLQSF